MFASLIRKPDPLLAAMLVWMIALPCFSAVVVWDGGGATANWSNPSNWSGDTVPGTSDQAFFGTNSDKSATIDAPLASVGGLALDGYQGTISGSLDVRGNAAIYSGAFVGALYIGGNLDCGAGADMFEASLLFYARTSFVNATSRVEVADITFSKDTSNMVYVSDSGTLVATGTVRFLNGHYGQWDAGYRGWIEAHGDVLVAEGWNGGGGQLRLAGDRDQVFDAMTREYQGPVVIAKTGGVVRPREGTGTYIALRSDFTVESGSLAGWFWAASRVTLSSAADMTNASLGFYGRTSFVDATSRVEVADITFSKDTSNVVYVSDSGTLVATGTVRFLNGHYGQWDAGYRGWIEAHGDILVAEGWNGGGGQLRLAGDRDQVFDAMTREYQGPVVIAKTGGVVRPREGTGTYIALRSDFTVESGSLAGWFWAASRVTLSSAADMTNASLGFYGRTSFVDATSRVELADITFYKDANNIVYVSDSGTLVATGTVRFLSGHYRQWDAGYRGWIEAQGDVMVGTAWNDGGKLVFAGDRNQAFDLTGAEWKYVGPVDIEKTGGAVRLVSGLWLDDGQNLTITAGTLDLNGWYLGVVGGAARFSVGAAGNLQLMGSEIITVNAGNPRFDAGSTVTYTGVGASYALKSYPYYNLTIAGGETSEFHLPGDTAVLGTLRVLSGILFTDGHNVSAGSLVNEGIVRLTGDEVSVSIGNIVSPGTIEYLNPRPSPIVFAEAPYTFSVQSDASGAETIGVVNTSGQARIVGFLSIDADPAAPDVALLTSVPFTVGPGATEGVSLNIDAADTAPGIYSGALRLLTDALQQSEASFEINVEAAAAPRLGGPRIRIW